MQNRRILLAAAGVAPLLSLALPARADQSPFRATLTVQFVLSQACATGDSACNKCLQTQGSFFVDAQGIADTTLGPLFAKVLKCALPPGSTKQTQFGTYAGTLTLSLTPPVTPPSLIQPPKDVLTLTYEGKNDDAGDFYGFGPFDGTLTIESGTGKFRGANGTLTFIAQGGASVPATELGVTPSPFVAMGNAFYLINGTINQGANQ